MAYDIPILNLCHNEEIMDIIVIIDIIGIIVYGPIRHCDITATSQKNLYHSLSFDDAINIINIISIMYISV